MHPISVFDSKPHLRCMCGFLHVHTPVSCIRVCTAVYRLESVMLYVCMYLKLRSGQPNCWLPDEPFKGIVTVLVLTLVLCEMFKEYPHTFAGSKSLVYSDGWGSNFNATTDEFPLVNSNTCWLSLGLNLLCIVPSRYGHL